VLNDRLQYSDLEAPGCLLYPVLYPPRGLEII
jgi:hypothetical protein